MTLNAIFYVFAAVLYLAAAFGIYKTLQEPEPTEKFWIRPLICAGLMIQAYLIYEALFLYGTPHFSAGNRERPFQTASASGDSCVQRDDDGAYPRTAFNGRS